MSMTAAPYINAYLVRSCTLPNYAAVNYVMYTTYRRVFLRSATYRTLRLRVPLSTASASVRHVTSSHERYGAAERSVCAPARDIKQASLLSSPSLSTLVMAPPKPRQRRAPSAQPKAGPSGQTAQKETTQASSSKVQDREHDQSATREGQGAADDDEDSRDAEELGEEPRSDLLTASRPCQR